MQFYYFLFFPYIIRSPLSMSSGSYVILWLQLLIISPESPPVATNDLTLRPSSCSILSQSPSSMAAVPKTTPTACSLSNLCRWPSLGSKGLSREAEMFWRTVLQAKSRPGGDGAAAERAVLVDNIDFCCSSEVDNKARQLIEIRRRNRSGNKIRARLRRVVGKNVYSCLDSGTKNNGLAACYALCGVRYSTRKLRHNGAYRASVNSSKP